MMLSSKSQIFLLASLFVLPLGLLGPVATANAGTEDAQITKPSNNESPQRVTEREKPEAGGRVIKRANQTEGQGKVTQQTSAAASD